MSSKFNIPTVIVVFGATGDLAKKKIFPALFRLFRNKELPKKFSIIGASRSAQTDDAFRTYLTGILNDFDDDPATKHSLEDFLKLCTYQQAQFGNLDDYKAIATSLGRQDNYWKICSNKLFYLAVPPHMYADMLKNITDSGLTEPCSPEEGWTRVLIEKPLGKDAQSAENIERMLGELFKEEQVYRIDHYLAKEMVQNILTFRFANNLLEESWNNKFIEKIELRMLEAFGVENRGGFYDNIGALRDVGQNHILQMLALVTMDCPATFTGEHIRDKRKEVLSSLQILSPERIKTNTFRGQYKGYTDIKDVKPASQTETYFKVKAYMNTPRWAGVPIIMESGKRLGQSQSEIIVTFKEVTPTPPGISEDKEFRNKVVFRIDPQEEIHISFISKKPGLKLEAERRDFDFVYRGKKSKQQKAEEYERVLLDCIKGDQMLFVTTEEVNAMWKFIDPIISAWEQNTVPLKIYDPGTNDIREASEIVERKELISHMPKEIAVIGLGKMGGNVALNLIDHGWTVHGYNRTYAVTQQYEKKGLKGAETLEELVKQLPSPRVFWIMVPAGAAVDDTIFGKDGLLKHLEKGDIVIDAGNSLYKDAQPRAEKLAKKGIKYMDVGTSGGPGGARNGACLMIGGDKKTFEYLTPLFVDLAIPRGFRFFEGYGAGHFVKMVHNGIEYGMMQAIAEGFAVMKASNFDLNLKDVADIYNHGSVIESRLIGWLKSGYKEYGEDLEPVSSTIAHTGEGAWTVDAANELNIPVPIIEGSLQFRKDSDKTPSYTGKIVSALRNQFGGHSIKK